MDDCGDARWPSQASMALTHQAKPGLRESAQPGTIVKHAESPQQKRPPTADTQPSTNLAAAPSQNAAACHRTLSEDPSVAEVLVDERAGGSCFIPEVSHGLTETHD